MKKNKRAMHKKMNEVLRYFNKMCHEKMDEALRCGVLSEESDFRDSDKYYLPRAIIEIVAENYNSNWQQRHKNEIRNLLHFI